MDNQLDSFGKTAQSLSRNPLGIIALFIVLVYAMACLVAVTGNFEKSERIFLIIFVTTFPVIVLACFLWLVACHWTKLYGPSDYRNEDNYIKAVTSLFVASSHSANGEQKHVNVNVIEQVVKNAVPVTDKRNYPQILWVDDRPENNIYLRQAFEAIGVEVLLALSTDQALDILSKRKFDVIISDMGRREGPREGYVLLDNLRENGEKTPFFIFASSRDPEHIKETLRHGGQGTTNIAEELFEMVMKIINQRK